jgi:hypothetical protein
MTIRVLTSHLVPMLADLLHTAESDADLGAVSGVLLHSDQGAIGVEPGKTSLLVGTSTDTTVVGHTWTQASGSLPPMLWGIEDVRAVIAVCKPLFKAEKTHVTILDRDGDRIVVREDPKLFGDGSELSFPAGKLNDFPRSLWRLLSDVHLRPAVRGDAGQELAPTARTDFLPRRLTPFIKVAASRGENLSLYTYHQFLPVLVQIGETYRGAVIPSRWPESLGGSEPDADLWPPDLPPIPPAAQAA